MLDGLAAVNRFFATWEFKFAETDAAETRGVFEGYGSVFNLMDSHHDVIDPVAFDRTLGEWKAKNTLPSMYMQHEQANPFISARPAGIWQTIEADTTGLAVRGKLIALDTEFGKLNYAQMRDGGMKGLSIAFSTPVDGAEMKKGEDGKRYRQLKDLTLYSVDIVAEPSNPGALVSQFKAMLNTPNEKAAAELLQKTHQMCMECMSGGDTPTKDERDGIMQSISDAHMHLTGTALRAKVKPETIRQLEDFLKEAAGRFGFKYSNSEVRAIAEGRAFKTAAPPRDEDEATKRLKALGEMRGAISGFSLPKIGD
jgi:HK97 family phage prohead protease